jgi:signal transduction histidine kinase
MRFNSLWIGGIIAVAGIGGALGFSVIAELDRARAVVDNNLKYWAPEFADIYSHKDWLRLSKLGRTFASQPVRSLVFRERERTVFSFPVETDETDCKLADHHVIEQYGAKLGSLHICHDPWVVLTRAAASPLFLLISLSLFFIISFAAVLPVLTLRRGLALLVDHLTEWSKSTTTTDAPGLLKIEGNHPTSLEGKIQTLTQDLVEKRLASERKALRDQIVRDVAHNIGSPIATLAIRVHQLNGISDEARRSVVEGLEQISGILAKLKAAANPGPTVQTVRARQSSGSQLKVESLSYLLDSIVSDKRLEKGELTAVSLQYELSSEGYGSFAEINPLDFRVVMSNLLNNAYDAIQGSGVIMVKLANLPTGVRITVADTGCGIAPNVLKNLFNEGFSHDKPGGSGRGLFHARNMLNQWHGTVDIASEVGQGTIVTLELPHAVPPPWFLPKLDLTTVDRVVVLDDDPSVCGFWQVRIPGLEPIPFSDAESFRDWIDAHRTSLSHPGSQTLFLIDLRLSENGPTGLDLVEAEGVAELSVLITTDANLESVRKRCAFLGARVLWKAEMGCVPIWTTLGPHP